MYQTTLFRKCICLTGLSVNNKKSVISSLVLSFSKADRTWPLQVVIQHFFSKTSKTGLKIRKLEMLENKSVTACKIKMQVIQKILNFLLITNKSAMVYKKICLY